MPVRRAGEGRSVHASEVPAAHLHACAPFLPPAPAHMWQASSARMASSRSRMVASGPSFQ